MHIVAETYAAVAIAMQVAQSVAIVSGSCISNEWTPALATKSGNYKTAGHLLAN